MSGEENSEKTHATKTLEEVEEAKYMINSYPTKTSSFIDVIKRK